MDLRGFGRSARKSSGCGRFRTDVPARGRSPRGAVGCRVRWIRPTRARHAGGGFGLFPDRFIRRSNMNVMKSALWGLALLTAATAAQAQNEQFLPVLSYRVGPYAAGGSGYYGGAIDYWTLVNMNGGVNGVKLSWEECEKEDNPAKGVECYERLKKKKGGATTVQPVSTRIADSPVRS